MAKLGYGNSDWLTHDQQQKQVNENVLWDCRIHQLQTTPNECPRYDTKQFDGEVPVMLELWGMQNTSSLLLLPGPLWLRVVAAPDRTLSMG